MTTRAPLECSQPLYFFNACGIKSKGRVCKAHRRGGWAVSEASLILLSPHPVPRQVFRFAVTLSSLTILPTHLTFNKKYQKRKNCEQCSIPSPPPRMVLIAKLNAFGLRTSPQEKPTCSNSCSMDNFNLFLGFSTFLLASMWVVVQGLSFPSCCFVF